MQYETTGAWVPKSGCQPSDTVSCTAETLPNQTITDPDFDPANPPNIADHTYKKILVKILGPAVPTASEATPAPSNAGYCTLTPPGGTYDPDTKEEKYCYAVVPNAYGPFLTATCPGTDASGNQEGEWTDPGNGVITRCTVTRSTWTADNDCVESPAVSPDYVRTFCKPGHGEPTANTLADVAEYYWKTDLRASDNCTGGPIQSDGVEVTNDVCTNNKTTFRQFMQTFTLGMGASGVMQYETDYKKYYVQPERQKGGGGCNVDAVDPTSDFYAICSAATADEGVCSWQLPGTECNWPRPGSDNSGGWQTNIDDLWHAAVNGRGTYFSAQNPGEVSSGISSALMEVTVKEGSRAEPVFSDTKTSSDNDTWGFKSVFTSESWTGDLLMYLIDPATVQAVEPAVWSAGDKLKGKAWGDRKIYTFDSTASNKLMPFAWTELEAAGKADYFQGANVADLTQMCATGTICLTPAAKNDPAFGQKLVDFLRGDAANEGAANEASKPFRNRTGDSGHNKLGDIVNSSTAYVQKPTRLYTDKGYSAHRSAMASRRGQVYVGANDGMLHAFDTQTGQETWAYVPSFVIPGLYWLADKNYSSLHHFYVDGTPVAGDVCFGAGCELNNAGSANWRTLLVGGLNHGGRGYYALDVTDPDNPKALWEFADDNLGYSYGNPLITKLASGKWVVLLASGYNNVSPGDGEGHLFVLDAETGALLSDVATGEGSTSAPSGLAKIAGWARNAEYNNTVRRVYGGDLLGNVWRFDPNDSDAAAHRLATLKDSGGNAQPITSAPEITLAPVAVGEKLVVYVGTGQLLGISDLETTSAQSFYAIKDDFLDSTSYTDLRGSGSGFVKQTMQSALCPDDNPYCRPGEPIVTVTNNAVDWERDNGWYVDFPVSGERVDTQIRLSRGVLTIVTNKPQSGACVPAGVSFRYHLNYRTGGSVVDTDGEAGYAGGKLGDYLSTGGPILGDRDTNSGDQAGIDIDLRPEIPPGSIPWVGVSWRELIVE
jgi:type IV pilus assembly protein PilY1